jgi:hypothetical protein
MDVDGQGSRKAQHWLSNATCNMIRIANNAENMLQNTSITVSGGVLLVSIRTNVGCLVGELRLGD